MLLYLQKHRINRQLRQQSTRAMTMIELLVVITIIMVLTAVMIPTIRYQYRNRALREAERQLNAFIGSAQARAQQLGRPVGIWIERFRNETLPPIAGAAPALASNNMYPTDANYAVTVYIAEVPLPYSGDVRDARVWLSKVLLPPDDKWVWQLNFPPTSMLLNSLNPLIRRGDHFQIKLDHHGHFFEAQRTSSPDQDGYVLTENPVGDGTRIPIAATTSTGVPFQIQRRPRKAFVPPLNLPVGSVIDLSVSGLAAGGNEFLTTATNGNRPVIIMFQPNGGIESVIFNGKIDRPQGWIHLLVGRQNQVFPIGRRNQLFISQPHTTGVPPAWIEWDNNLNKYFRADTETTNVLDMNNRWVSINHRTGSITSENVDSIIRYLNDSNSPRTPTVYQTIAAARQLVRSGTGSGGN